MRWSLRRRPAEPAYVSVLDWINRGIAVLKLPPDDDRAPRDAAIAGLQQALDRLPRSHPRRDLATQVLIQLLVRRYVDTYDDADVQRADELLPDDLRRRPSNAPSWVAPASLVSTARFLRWEDSGDAQDLDRSLVLMAPRVEQGDDAIAVLWLGRAHQQFLFYGETAELDSAAARVERVLDGPSTLDDDARSAARASLGSVLVDRATLGSHADGGQALDRGIALLEEVLAHAETAASPFVRATLSYAVRCRGARDGRREDLDRSLELCSDASDAVGLVMRAYGLQARYHSDVRRGDLDAALRASRDAQTAFDRDRTEGRQPRFRHERARAWVATATMDVLGSLYWCDGSSPHLDELLALRDSLPEPLSPDARTNRAWLLADQDLDRSRITGDASLLEHAIAQLTDPQTLPSTWDGPWFVRLLASALLDRAEVASDRSGADVEWAEQLLDLAQPRGDRVRWAAFVDADRGRAMLLRGAAAGDASLVRAAAELVSTVVAHEPEASAMRPRYLRSLGAAHEASYELAGDPADLRSAVAAYDAALAHPCAHTVAATDIVDRVARLRAQLDGEALG